MTVPEFSGKIGIERLAHIRTEALTQETSYAVEASILYSESVSGFQFDYLWYPNRLCCTNRLTAGVPLFPDRPILRPS